MQEWSMAPNSSDGAGNATGNADNQLTTDHGYRVAATFDSPNDEHYYGLGQNQQGFWIYAIMKLAVGMITTPLADKACVCHS